MSQYLFQRLLAVTERTETITYPRRVGLAVLYSLLTVYTTFGGKKYPTAFFANKHVYVCLPSYLPQPRVYRSAQERDDLGRVLGSKHSTASHDYVCASVCGLVDSTGSQATVNLDVQLRIPLPQLLHLGQLACHELLPSKARLHRHDEDHLQQGQHRTR